jgi:RIO kinase 1
MELVTDEDGNVAPRLNDVEMSETRAVELHTRLLNEVVRMLCAGVIHGDLSEYNILLAADGPVIIDLPQAVDAAGNLEAPAMLERDVDNLATYFGRFAPHLLTAKYGKEIWALFEGGGLHPEVQLTGRVELDTTPVDLDAVLQELEDTRLEEEARVRHEQSLREGS